MESEREGGALPNLPAGDAVPAPARLKAAIRFGGGRQGEPQYRRMEAENTSGVPVERAVFPVLVAGRDAFFEVEYQKAGLL